MKEEVIDRLISKYNRFTDIIVRIVNRAIPGALLYDLHECAKEKKGNDDVFEYNVGKIILPVKIENVRHLHPSFAAHEIDRIDLICSACGEINSKKWTTQEIPLEKSNFKMELHVLPFGTNQSKWVSAVHIDGVKPNTMSAEVHPLFHVQYVNESKMNDFEALSMDVPRLVHYPVDVISGLDIALQNYFPRAYKEIIMTGEYVDVLRDVQTHCIFPYFRTLAQFQTNKDFAKLLCPYLI